MCLDPELLAQMAAQGTALTPTLTVITDSLEHARLREDSPRKEWYVGGASAHPALVAAAAEAGVTLLAGTDSRPHGMIAAEIRALAAAGVPADVALGAASWTARDYLGIPCLVDGAPADAVVYDTDPRGDLSVLGKPRAVILRGRLARRRKTLTPSVAPAPPGGRAEAPQKLMVNFARYAQFIISKQLSAFRADLSVNQLSS
jgi:imidazolonepropionase-like amidohydrolase